MALPQNTTILAYTRVSTTGQDTGNQRLEIEQAGWPVAVWYEDAGVSGKIPAAQRPQFAKMLADIEVLRRAGTKIALVVSKLDRLGRDAMDVQATIRKLADLGVRVYVLMLGDVDLTSSTGKLMLAMLSAVAEMERDLLVERTKAGLAKAKAEGKKFGRKPLTTPRQQQEIRKLLAGGTSVSELARKYNVSRATIINIRAAEGAAA